MEGNVSRDFMVEVPPSKKALSLERKSHDLSHRPHQRWNGIVLTSFVKDEAQAWRKMWWAEGSLLVIMVRSSWIVVGKQQQRKMLGMGLPQVDTTGSK